VVTEFTHSQVQVQLLSKHMTITKLSPGLIEPGTIQTADLSTEVTANINYALITANAAFNKANTGVTGVSGNNFISYKFPLSDFGYVSESFYGGLGNEEIGIKWDNKLTPQPQEWSVNEYSSSNTTIVMDAGYLT
jgi:hypothetical protein